MLAKTLTLKNLPDALHARLAAADRRHRRSLTHEATAFPDLTRSLDPFNDGSRVSRFQPPSPPPPKSP